MKSYFVAIIACMAIATTTIAQNSNAHRVFGKGQTDIQLGVGLLPSSKILDDADTKFIPVTLQASHFFGKNFSLGLAFTRAASQGQPIIISDGLSQRVTNTLNQAALRAAFHITKVDNVDFYGGFLAGLNMEKFTVDQGNMDYLMEYRGLKENKTTVAYTGFIGTSIAFTKHISAFAEAGFGASFLTAGIGYRL